MIVDRFFYTITDLTRSFNGEGFKIPLFYVVQPKCILR